MEHILQRVIVSARMFMIDGFLSYNQIYILPEYREKTTFTTPWGTFMYAKMPFGLMNAGATFQRAMDIAFIGEKENLWSYIWMTLQCSQDLIRNIIII
jgi:hypothetical protein